VAGQFAKRNKFAVGVGQPEIRCDRPERQHSRGCSSHAENCAEQRNKVESFSVVLSGKFMLW
jgi:hypothetical protein